MCVCIFVCVCTLATMAKRGTVTTEMDVLASSEGSQLVWVRKLVLASARSGGSLHLCSLGAQLEGVGEVWGCFPPARQVLKETHPLSPYSPTGVYTGSKTVLNCWFSLLIFLPHNASVVTLYHCHAFTLTVYKYSLSHTSFL